MSSISVQHKAIFTLDEILQDMPETATEDPTDIDEDIYKQELNEELKTTDRIWLEFHAGQCEQYGKAAKSLLYRVVKSSVGYPENSVAAANAITILKTMKVSFSCLDLRGIQIPYADLTRAILDMADVTNANLEHANLTNASLNHTDLSDTNLKNIKFNLPNKFIHEYKVCSSIISSDNKYLISEDTTHTYFWDILNKTYIKKIEHLSSSNDMYWRELIFTSDEQFLFIYDGKQNIDIWQVGSFKHIKKMQITDEESEIYFAFPPNGNFFITYNYNSIKFNTYLKIWEIQKKENNLLKINLKNEAIILYRLSNIYFSKKFPIFYCLQEDENATSIELSIWDIDRLFEVTNRQALSNDLKIINGMEFFLKRGKRFSLVACSTSKDNEELLFVAIGSSIYSISILGKNEQNSRLQQTQVIKITTEIDIIYNMQVLEKTNELIYLCKDTINLYSIKDKKIISKFKILDTALKRVSVSLNGAYIYINCLNTVLMWPIDYLENSKYFSFDLDCKASCLSSDRRSVISISNSFYMQIHDIETGSLLKSNFLQKIKSHVSSQYVGYKFLFSPDTQYILMNNSVVGFDNPYSLDIINIENEAIYLENISNRGALVISNNSEYLALLKIKKILSHRLYRYMDTCKTILSIYKTTPFKQLVGEFDLGNYKRTQAVILVLTIDFFNKPKAALEIKSKITVFNFNFNNEKLELSLHPKILSIEENEILHLTFAERDTKLIVVCKKKLIIWNIEENKNEEYKIQASCADISRDGLLLIYHDIDIVNTSNQKLCLWNITQKRCLIAQSLSLAITKLQISPDNRYIMATTENSGMYVWKIIGNTFRLLWRTSHNLQAQRLKLRDNNLEKDIEEELITKMRALKISNI